MSNFLSNLQKKRNFLSNLQKKRNFFDHGDINDDIKTAVFLTGAPRTWNFCKDYIINFVNDVYGKNCDWFVSLHKSDTASKEEINEYLLSKSQKIIYIETFEKKDLPCYNHQWHLDKWDNTFLKHSFYLNYVAGLKKRLHEFKTGKIYFRTFFARPDCVYLYNEKTKDQENNINDIRNYIFHLGGDFNDISCNFYGPSANDLCLVAGSIASDLLQNRIYSYPEILNVKKMNFRLGICTHAGLSTFSKKHNITVIDKYRFGQYSDFNFYAEVIRPTHITYNRKKIETLQKIYNNFNLSKYDLSPGDCEYFRHPNWSTEFIIRSCLELGIDLNDYGLGHYTSKKHDKQTN